MNSRRERERERERERLTGAEEAEAIEGGQEVRGAVNGLEDLLHLGVASDVPGSGFNSCLISITK